MEALYSVPVCCVSFRIYAIFPRSCEFPRSQVQGDFTVQFSRIRHIRRQILIAFVEMWFAQSPKSF